MLVAGNVIIGRREEKDPAEADAENGSGIGIGVGGPGGGDEEGEDLLGEEVELDNGVDTAGKGRERVGEHIIREEDEDILDLGDEEGKYKGRAARRL